MKKLNSILVLVLFVVGMMASSCSSYKGCRGKKGGWYGDRNLGSVELQQPKAEWKVMEGTATEHCSD